MKKVYIAIIALLVFRIGFSKQVSQQQKSILETIAYNSKVNKSANWNTEIIKPKNEPSSLVKTRKEIRGDKYSFNYSYDKAIKMYLGSKKLTLDGQRNLAFAYYQMDLKERSEEVYVWIVQSGEVLLPEDYYNYAKVLKENGKQDISNKWMDKFSEIQLNDLRAIDYLANKTEISNWSVDKGLYKIVPMNTNTKSQDFSPSFYKDKIVFASSRTTSKFIEREDNWHDIPYLDIFVSEVENGQLQTPKVFNKSLYEKFHVGPASFNKEGTFMAYTRNTVADKSKDRIIELQIWFSSFHNEKWSEPVAFPFNQPAYSVGQPCLTSDGNTMYFTSNMPGGFGNADIYKTTKDDKGVWSKPENLGNKVNTEGDELFPFYEEKSGKMFYASEGKWGLGGLDIYIYEMKGSGSVYNAGAALNTIYDDFALIIDGEMKHGYFCSNRPGGMGSDDIYAVEFMKKEVVKIIAGIAKNQDEKPLPNTFITLFDDKGAVLKTAITAENGAYKFVVATNKNFKLNGKKDNFKDGNSTANTFGKDSIAIVNLTLEEIPKAITKTTELNKDLGAILALKNIYFDYDKSHIRPDAKIELYKIIDIMNQYPQMIVELNSYTDCRGTEAYNQALSTKRAKSTLLFIQKGITKPNRISGKGNGEAKLSEACPCEGKVIPNCTENEYQKERNTEFIIMNEVVVPQVN